MGGTLDRGTLLAPGAATPSPAGPGDAPWPAAPDELDTTADGTYRGPSAFPVAWGLWLLLWGCLTAFFALGATLARARPSLRATLASLASTFWLLGAGTWHAAGRGATTRVGAYVGLITAGCALWCASEPILETCREEGRAADADRTRGARERGGGAIGGGVGADVGPGAGGGPPGGGPDGPRARRRDPLRRRASGSLACVAPMERVGGGDGGKGRSGDDEGAAGEDRRPTQTGDPGVGAGGADRPAGGPRRRSIRADDPSGGPEPERGGGPPPPTPVDVVVPAAPGSSAELRRPAVVDRRDLAGAARHPPSPSDPAGLGLAPGGHSLAGHVNAGLALGTSGALLVPRTERASLFASVGAPAEARSGAVEG